MMHRGALSTVTLILFLGIIMVASSFSMSSTFALLPEKIPDVSKAPSKVRVIEGDNVIAYARPLYTSFDDPSNHEVLSSNPHNGVAKLILTRSDGTFGCSGTLATGSLHVITAAHCVADDFGNYILSSGTATFEGNSESITISIDPLNSVSHPDYDGDFIKGNDIAVLKLASPAPLQIPAIPHATSDNSVGQIVDKTGYGWSGFFSSGADSSTYPFGIERDGQNKYDDFADTMYLALGLNPNSDFVPQAIYQYDSDDGTVLHDAFDFFFGNSNLGLGNAEVISAPGDSGGPTILNGELVGVTSYGITLEFSRGPPPRTSDCTTEGASPILDSSCGEFAGDTRVSVYVNFIDSVLNTAPNNQPTVTITSPADGSQFHVGVDDNIDFIGFASDTEDDDSVLTADLVWTSNLDGQIGTGERFSTTLSEGTHTVTASVTDSDGNAGNDSVTVNVVNDVPAVLITSPADGSIFDSGATISFAGSASDTEDGDLTADLVWTSNLDGQIGTGGIFSTTLNDGTHTITASTSDVNGATGSDSITIAVGDPPAEPTITVDSISYTTFGGKNNDKHLDTTVSLVDDQGNTVSGASVSITLANDSGQSWTGTATTDSDGNVIFSLKNAPSGCYETTVTDVAASGLTWDTDTPLNQHCK